MEREAIVETIKGLRPALNREGVTHVALFGSRARGDNRQDSDIDLLLDVDPTSRFSILNLVGVEQLVRDAIGIPANAFMRRSLEPEFQRTIAGDVVEVF